MKNGREILNAILPSVIAVCSALSLITIHFSSAISSIALGTTIFATLLLAWSNHLAIKSLPWFYWILPILVITQVVVSSIFYPVAGIAPKLLLKIPLLFLPVLCFGFGFVKPHTKNWLLAVNLPITWIGISSVVYYISHYQFLNQMVLESKPLPIFSQVYHIEFSVILASTAFISLAWLIANRKDRGDIFSQLLWTVVICNVICLHVLSARTGILCFWAGIFGYLLTKVKGRKISSTRWKQGFAALALVIIFVISIPSLRNRVRNTWQDFNSVRTHQNLNNKSFGQRWVAWQASINLIAAKPIHGHGITGVETALMQEYDKLNTHLQEANRLMPHNQYLDTGAQSGLSVLFLLLFFLATFIWMAWKSQNSAALGITLLFATAFVFESLLERQAGVLAFLVMLSATWGIFNTRKKST